MDLLPTFGRLAGVNTPFKNVDGHDISGLLFKHEKVKSPYKAFYYYQQQQLQAIRSGPWKLFLPITPAGQHPHFARSKVGNALLFNVVEDVGCKNNVADKHPDVVGKLLRLATYPRQELGDIDLDGSVITGDGQREVGEVNGQPVPLKIKKE